MSVDEEPQQVRQRRAKCATLTNAMQEGYTIEVRCRQCGHRRIINPVPLWRLVRVRLWPEHFMELGKHVRCGHCRSKWPELRASSQPADRAKAVGFTTEAEALEAARRMRS